MQSKAQLVSLRGSLSAPRIHRAFQNATGSHESGRIETHRNNLAGERKIMEQIVRTMRDSSFVHCYLACGHMITTMANDDLKGSPPSIECWACEETIKQGVLSKYSTTTTLTERGLEPVHRGVQFGAHVK
jgi:hypothetical protein